MLISNVYLLEILFELTLFFLLSIVIYKIIKIYLLPALYTEIELVKKRKKDFLEKNELLKASDVNLKKQILEQEKKFVFLEDKTNLWYQNRIKEQQEKQIANDLYIKQIEQKRKKQNKNWAIFKTQQLVIPNAIKQAKKEINNLYSKEKSLGLLEELLNKIGPKES